MVPGSWERDQTMMWGSGQRGRARSDHGAYAGRNGSSQGVLGPPPPVLL